jgi:retron-type reverse transcriptase
MNAFERSITFDNLTSIWRDRFKKLRRSCYGVDRVSAEKFEQNRAREIREIRARFLEERGPFKSYGLLALAKKKPDSDKYRIICVPTMADRLIQFAMLRTLKGKLKPMGLDNSVSFGIAEGADRGVKGARSFACHARDEHPWVYKTDIQQFFDNIQRDDLAVRLSHAIRQPSLLKYLEVFLRAEITEGFDRNWRAIVTANGIRKGRGVRQGMPLSPLFAGVYLRDFDRSMARLKVPVARYVDDIVAFFDTERAARDFHNRISDALGSIGLSLGPLDAVGSKTAIIPPGDPAPFLGMEICRSPTGVHRLQVSASCIGDCVKRIRAAGDLDFLSEKRVRLTAMGQYFRSIVNGYVHAYAEARNCDDLKDGIEHAAQAAQAAILRELFGKARLESLSAKQFEFLGVEREAILLTKETRASRAKPRAKPGA